MVGVPFLRSRWPLGPSGRIGCPLLCLRRSQRIRCGPRTKLINNAVTTAPPERKVM